MSGTVGAVIVAAGLSSRMGAFKPLMRIGPDSVAQHVINTFRQAGVRPIVVVTGHNADLLERHLKADDIIFLQNENYRTTDMFQSAKIGFKFCLGKCERVLFTPVDVPLFVLKTVERLIRSNGRVACPVCRGKQGHPIILDETLLYKLLADNGPGGVKGAISRLGVPVTRVKVDDPGVLRDADTPEEFEQLVEYYNCRLIYPSEQEIDKMLLQMETPQDVRDHCEAVAEQAVKLAAAVDEKVNIKFLRAACRLHDMARANGMNHAEMAARYLWENGYSYLAEVVVQHHDLTQHAPIEAQLLYLADKQVQGTLVVSLDERFARSKAKCRTKEALELWEKRFQDAVQIAQRYGLDL